MRAIFKNLLPVWAGGSTRSTAQAAEARNVSLATCTPTDIWGMPSDWAGGMFVNRKGALSVPAVWDAVKKVSETLASLPLDLFLKSEGGSRPAEGHPVRYLVRSEPSPNVSSYVFRRALFANACFGDAFARIHRNGIGRPVRLELMTGQVSVVETASGETGYVWYWSRGGKSGQEVLLASEVLHIRGFSLDNTQGLDVSSVHRDTLGFAIGANQYGNAFFNNNAAIDKVLYYPDKLDQKQHSQLSDKINRVSGAKKSGSTIILDGGMTMDTIGLSPEKSMLNESRAFQVNEVARVFGVPVHLLQNMDRATFNNIELMTTLFVTLCLRPWAVQAEQEMAIKLLTRAEKESGNYFFRHNFEGLLRGDTASRSAFYASGILNGWITRNEVREKENLNTLEGLDRPLVPLNMAEVDENGNIVPQPEGAQTNATTAQPGSGGKKQDDGTPQSQSG